MPFVAADPHALLGAEGGHCLPHVQQVAGVTHSSTLRRGARVLDTDNIPRGTVIGTFAADGRYANTPDGNSHVAILLHRNDVDRSLLVVDTWIGKPVGERIIRDKGGAGWAADDSSRYYVVETA
jgi:hypothetical protein